MTERNTVVLKSPNQVVKQTGDKKRWGAIYKVAKTTECFTELKCVRTQIFSSKLTDIHFSISTLWSFSILQLIHTYTPGLRKMTRLHTYTHTHAYIHPHTCIHTDTHTRTHTHTHTAEWRMKLWFECYWETWQFLPFELAVKCISQIKWHQWHMSGLTD